MKKLLLLTLLSTRVFASGFFGGGGGGASIGGGVSGGTDNSVLFIHPDGTLAQDNPSFTYTLSTTKLSTPNLKVSGLSTGICHASSAGDITSSLIVNADVSASAAIALSKLAALSNSIVPVTNGSGVLSSSSVTATELGYVSGVTSAIQTQLNGKQASGNYITALTGDATAAGPDSAALTLATVNGNVGSFTNASLTVNAKGLITAASSGSAPEVPLTFSTGLTRTVNTVTVNTSQNIATLSNLTSNGFVKTSGGVGTLSIDTSTYLTGNQTITLSGDISGSGTTAITTTIGAAKVTNAMLAGLIDLTTKVTGALPIANGGTGQTTANPAFNALSPLTTKGDVLTYSTVNARLGVGSNNQVLTADSSQTTGIKWASAPSPVLSVASKTANYTITTSDNIVLGDSSGGTFTLTLPTAVGNTNLYTLKKIDSTATAVSIATTSSQTIDGITTAALTSQYESLQLYSDGSNWQVLVRRIPSVWVAYTPTLVGFGTATNVAFYSRRVGDSLEIQGFFTAGTTTATTATISMGYNGTAGNVSASTVTPAQTGANYSAVGYYASNSNLSAPVMIVASTDTVLHLGIMGSAASGLTPITGANISNSQNVSLWARIPINGWGG